MIKRLSLLTFVLLCASLFSPVFSREKEIRVIPAEGIGPCRIGGSFFDLKKSFGDPSFSKTLSNGDILAKYSEPGLIIQFQGYTGEIHFIGVEKRACGDSVYRTVSNIEIGASKASVESALGTPDQTVPVVSKDVYPISETLAIYIDKGISFHYDSAGAVVVIIVFSPAVFGH